MLITPVIELSMKIVRSVFFVMRILMVRLLKILDVVMNAVEGFKWTCQ